MDINKVEIEVTQATSWERAKRMALQTIGKKMVTLPDDRWKAAMLMCQHSPIRMVEYEIHIKNIPQWVSVHLVRHFMGVEKFVRTQREDRNAAVNNRDSLPQGEPNEMMFVCNAEALINISRRRLCACASPETRQVWEKVKEKVAEVDPVMARFMVKNCIYRGFCPEFESCNFDRTHKFKEQCYQYRLSVGSQI